MLKEREESIQSISARAVLVEREEGTEIVAEYVDYLDTENSSP